ncbi:hypothetical protein F2Q69_00046324 [Brassica cretica]|uniref:Dolichol-phosphate mannosyltransferase subunit 3 n=1 Tax=Brassica cretica TaxID=69181 RepID=A0A8S9PK59_BRACR|nr:hypothetical protein F2Q69_00046324 [Brassica cretica]
MNNTKLLSASTSAFSVNVSVQHLQNEQQSAAAYLHVFKDKMKHIVKILSLLLAVSAFWIGLLQAAIIHPGYNTWLLPIYFVVSLGCYGLLMVGLGLMQFPTCPQEALLLQHDIAEAKDFFKHKGVDVGSD